MAAGLSPQIRLLPGGERRLLTDIGRVDPTSMASAREHGTYAALERAVTRLTPEEVIAEIEAAGLRGRGGSGFPTATKWRVARDEPADRKIVVANLMSADPSSLGDRALAEGHPHLVIEGLLIAAYAIGASEAIIAVRQDWTDAVGRLRDAAREATDERFAGYLVLGTDTSIQLGVWEGSGAYVAGEETALINALAGDRGMPAIRPPFPATRGLHGAPTVVQNAETLAHVAWIVAHSADAFASVGGGSRGTKLVTVMGRVSRPGVLEVPLGTPLIDVLAMAGGGTGTTKALFVGGPGGGAIDAGSLTVAFDYEPLDEAGAIVGSGSILVTDSDTCMVDTARFFVDFSAREACGKAVPCRIGTLRLREALDRILAGTPRPNDIVLLRELSQKVSDTALCKLERLASRPILSTLDRFPEEYRAHAERGECLSGACRAAGMPPLLRPLDGLATASDGDGR